jgi:hypothetical protein
MRRVGLIKNNEENCNTVAIDEKSMRNSLSVEFTEPGGSLFEIPEKTQFHQKNYTESLYSDNFKKCIEGKGSAPRSDFEILYQCFCLDQHKCSIPLKNPDKWQAWDFS